MQRWCRAGGAGADQVVERWSGAEVQRCKGAEVQESRCRLRRCLCRSEVVQMWLWCRGSAKEIAHVILQVQVVQQVVRQVVQEWCRWCRAGDAGAEVVQEWCRGGGAEVVVQRWWWWW